MNRMSTVSADKRETSSDASSRLRRAHPTVWSVAVPVGALAVWEVISVVLVVALPNANDGVLSIAADLLVAPALVWFYLHTRGATTPAKTHWTWLLVAGLCALVVVEYFSAQSLYAGISAVVPAGAEENYQEQMFDQDEVSFYILAVAVAPPVEELLYRGVLYGRMRSINVWLANVVQIILFTIAHPVITFVPVIAMFAFLQALIFEVTGRLWVCMVVHALANSGLLLLLYSAVGLGIDTIALSVSIPLYFIVWALLVWLYCRVRNSKAPAEQARKREFDEQMRQQRWQRMCAKLEAAHVHVTEDGKPLLRCRSVTADTLLSTTDTLLTAGTPLTKDTPRLLSIRHIRGLGIAGAHTRSIASPFRRRRTRASHCRRRRTRPSRIRIGCPRIGHIRSSRAQPSHTLPSHTRIAPASCRQHRQRQALQRLRTFRLPRIPAITTTTMQALISVEMIRVQ